MDIATLFENLADQRWLGAGALINLLYTIATVVLVLVNIFYVFRFVALQSSLNAFYKDQDRRQSEMIIENLQRERLLSLSSSWNSESFIRARIQTNMHFESHHPTEVIEYTEQNLQLWTSISMIAHFFERIGILAESDQLNANLASQEYKIVSRYWFRRLRYIYSPNSGEANLHNRWTLALRSLGWTEKEIEESWMDGPGEDET